MQDFRQKIIINSLCLAGFCSLASSILGKISFMQGIIIGTVTSVLNFLILDFKVKATVKKDAPNIFLLFGNLIFRYLFMAAALWMATKISVSAFFGAALGLFMIRFGIYIFAYQEKRQESKIIEG